MSGKSKEVMVDFGKSFASSELFDKIFKEGMSLVEETASYLDGDGRIESQKLSRQASYTYASESMRLTTRLMQLASWLLLQRAVKEGEMSLSDALGQNLKIKDFSEASTKNIDELPQELQTLISSSLRLNERILRLDEMLRGEKDTENTDVNPVNDQVNRLHEAFGSGLEDR